MVVQRPAFSAAGDGGGRAGETGQTGSRWLCTEGRPVLASGDYTFLSGVWVNRCNAVMSPEGAEASRARAPTRRGLPGAGPALPARCGAGTERGLFVPSSQLQGAK